MADAPKPPFVPAAPAPPGFTPNFENPEYIGARLNIVIGVFTGLILICTALRLYTRASITRALGIDDCACKYIHSLRASGALCC